VNQFLLAAVAAVHADDAPRHTGPDFGKASPFGLLVIVLLLISVLFLMRSMNRQLKKVPESFDRDKPEPDQAADIGTIEVDGGAEDSDGPPHERDGPDR
jgi:hypothetical protein